MSNCIKVQIEKRDESLGKNYSKMATNNKPGILPNRQSPQADSSEDLFDKVVELLKHHEALSPDCFIKDLPYFTFVPLSKELQVLELFQSSCDLTSYRALLKNIVPLPQDLEIQLSRKNPHSQTMTFAQVCLYKFLPCPNFHCPNRPREIVTHNQYRESEYKCPFYHHERDRRRLVISPILGEEFEYKASYYEEGRNQTFKEKYSQNYFESMFHPIYYKLFRCRRESCESYQFCPFFHSDQEKKMWDSMFSSFMKKERIHYVKDKQKYYENSSNSAGSTDQESQDENQYQSPKKTKNNNQNKQSLQKENNPYKKSPSNQEGPIGNSGQKPLNEAKNEAKHVKLYQGSNRKARRVVRHFDSDRKNGGVIQA